MTKDVKNPGANQGTPGSPRGTPAERGPGHDPDMGHGREDVGQRKASTVEGDPTVAPPPRGTSAVEQEQRDRDEAERRARENLADQQSVRPS